MLGGDGTHRSHLKQNENTRKFGEEVVVSGRT